MSLSIPPPVYYPFYGQYGWYGFDTGFMPLKHVFEVSLVGYEEHHTIGVFLTVWDARSAAAKAALSYRRWCRENLDDLDPPRGLDLKPRVKQLPIDTYQPPWWES